MASVGVGVSIGARNVRVVQVRRQKDGTWQLTRALIAPLAEADPPEQRRLAEARSAVTSAQVKGPALIGATGRDLIMRYTHVPPVPDWRLEMLMNFEIQEVSEQSGGDVSAAYAQLDVDDTTSGDKVVLVALAKNGYLRPRLDALTGAGLDVLGLCPNAVAAFWAYRENGKLGADETVVVLHVGHENTDIAIARKGTLLFARNVAGGGKMLTDAVVQNLRVDATTAEKLKITKGNMTSRGKAKYRDSSEEKIANAMMQAGGHFVSAVNSSVMFAKAQTKVPDCVVNRVVVMGGGALLKGFADYLESNLNLPVEVFDPVTSLDLSALPAQSAEAVKQDQSGMAVAIGLAQLAADEASLRVAILPADTKKKRQFREKTLFTIAGAAVLVVGLIVAWTMRSDARAEGLRERAVLDARKSEGEKNASEFELAKRRVEVVTSQKDALRRIVAVGPAYDIIASTVQGVLNPGGTEDRFPEIFIHGLSAKPGRLSVKNESEGEAQAIDVVEVTMSGTVVDLGSGPVAQKHSDFMQALKRRINEVGGIELASDSGLDASKTFKIVVRQTKTPEEVEAERAKEKAEAAKAEENK